MALRTCMNILCGTTSSPEWKTGWSLRSGELAKLCDKCGFSFEQRTFCDEFHADDSGWRQCVTCGKRLHCGCIASLSLIELLDGGGVKCVECARTSDCHPSAYDGKCDGTGSSAVIENSASIKQLNNYKGSSNGSPQPSILRNCDTSVALGLLNHEELLLPLGEATTTCVSSLTQSSMGLFQKARLELSTMNMQAKDNYEAVAQPNLNITLGVPTGNSQTFPGVIVDEREQRKMSNAFPQGFLSHHLLPRSPKLPLSPASDTNVNVIPTMRVARPPVEGRGRHQLLPRYWPRITDQELQQITGDSNCTIVPLFEKVLSASDAGRIGRLVLPKACAEAYFPPISQAEGLPIKIQDVKGKDWVFQFRFWPNNNSRMYVLEGVTPCIQSMQLQAGDTVTFSRMDPEGKLVMGFRKASNSVAIQSIKGSTESHMNALSRQPDSSSGNISWPNGEKYGERAEEGMSPSSMLERKKSRNIGSKSKRLLIDSQDVLALRLTWEEVQGMLRPPQSAKPSVVVIEDYEFEEYEEPPVFGKSSIFTARSTGVIEQWAQCDSCSKWRRLPADVLLPPKWSCAENLWDQSRCSCSAPDELGPRELEKFLQLSKESKKRRMGMANRTLMQEQESSSSGLDALANAAVLGDNNNNNNNHSPSDPGSSSSALPGPTTRHPRHRPGCSCIVCIQPPSGKGKHKSTCTCTVCMTVKRRFKTLMMRKKKRQSDQEAEITATALQNNPQLKQNPGKDEGKSVKTHHRHPPRESPSEDEGKIVKPYHHRHEGEDAPKAGPAEEPVWNPSGELDLNCHPDREEELRVGVGSGQGSLTSLLQLAGFPLEAYIKQRGLSSLTSEQQGGFPLHLVGQALRESEGGFRLLAGQVLGESEGGSRLHVEQVLGESEGGQVAEDHPPPVVAQALHEQPDSRDGNSVEENKQQQKDPL